MRERMVPKAASMLELGRLPCAVNNTVSISTTIIPKGTDHISKKTRSEALKMFRQLRIPPHHKVPRAVSEYSRLPAGSDTPSADDSLRQSIPCDLYLGRHVYPQMSSRP